MSSSDSDNDRDNEHANLQAARKTKGYTDSQRCALAKFFRWYKHHHNEYNVFTRHGDGTFTLKTKKWIQMMEKFKGKGNALFDYCLYARKKHHEKNEQGMGTFRDIRAAIWNLCKEDGCAYTQ